MAAAGGRTEQGMVLPALYHTALLTSCLSRTCFVTQEGRAPASVCQVQYREQ